MTRWNYYPQTLMPKEFFSKPSKYHSKKIEIDGITFDSKKEAKRYEELKTLESLGEIEGLELQKKFVLIPTQREPDTVGPRGGIKKGKVIEKECAYFADFYYHDLKADEWVVEDTKSPITRTPVYKVKKKLMLYVHGIRIKEI